MRLYRIGGLGSEDQEFGAEDCCPVYLNWMILCKDVPFPKKAFYPLKMKKV